VKENKVAVLYGGMSAEREVSLRSGKAAYDALVRLGYDTALIDMDKDVAFKIREAGRQSASSLSTEPTERTDVFRGCST